MISAIITAAGNGSRANLNVNKLLYKINGVTVLEKTLSIFENCSEIDQIIVTSSKNDFDTITALCSKISQKTEVCLGGETRTQSVKNALDLVKGEIVLIHDGARPFATEQLLLRCIDGVRKFGSAIASIDVRDTLANVNEGEIIDTFRKNVVALQTPQAFFTKDILFAYSKITDNDVYTDDSSVYKAFVGNPHVCDGEEKNVKLTYRDDFESAFRVGIGFDLHTLVEGRKLILGGIEIPHAKGLLGHSDADALTHAIMDSLLSALSLRDIGYHFPDTDPKYKGADSIQLLKHVLQMIGEKGYEVNNVSAVIMAQKPKLSTFIPKITNNLAKVINISTFSVGITCTTMEKVGLVGREEAIACEVYSMLKRKI